MTLSSRSILVRFAYIFAEVPQRTSLCKFFWRCFVFVPAAALSAGFFLGIFLFAIWKNPLPFFTVMGTIIGSILAVMLFMYLREVYRDWKYDRRRKRDARRYDLLVSGIVEDPTTLEVIGYWFSSVKRKFCPLIDIQ